MNRLITTTVLAGAVLVAAPLAASADDRNGHRYYEGGYERYQGYQGYQGGGHGWKHGHYKQRYAPVYVAPRIVYPAPRVFVPAPVVVAPPVYVPVPAPRAYYPARPAGQVDIGFSIFF